MWVELLSLVELAMPSAAWGWRVLAFILVRTAELFFIQRYTLVSAQDVSAQFLKWAPRIRLLIDLTFVVAITALLPRPWLIGVSILAFFAQVGLVSYYQYFRRPLSALALYHWREGSKASGHRFPASPRIPLLILGAALAVKVGLLATLPADSGLNPPAWWVIGLSAAAIYAALIVAAGYIDPLDKILTTRGIGRLGLIRGYLFTWLAEFYYLGANEVLESAMRQRQIVSDQLTPLETAIPVRRQLIIIQAESLDFNVIGYQANGCEVTPFLNRLWDKSLRYRIAAARYIGSADADFVMLNGVMPSMHIVTYNIPNYPYSDTLPQFLSQHGYETSIYHGNTGNFYNRRSAFERMGFSNICFEEEMVLEQHLPQISWGIEDRHVLQLSRDALSRSIGPTCHVIITLSTHTPYTLVSGEGRNRDIYPKPQSMAQNYLNSMRYLDNELRNYVDSLEASTVVIFSDHPADLAVSPEFKPDYQGSREFVPCLIYDTEFDLGGMQRTRHGLADDGQLTLLDISTYLRTQIANGQAGKSLVATPVGESQPNLHDA